MNKLFKSMKSWDTRLAFFSLVLGIIGNGNSIALTSQNSHFQSQTQIPQKSIGIERDELFSQIAPFEESGQCYVKRFGSSVDIYVDPSRRIRRFSLRDTDKFYLEGNYRDYGRRNTLVRVEIFRADGLPVIGYVDPNDDLIRCDDRDRGDDRNRERQGEFNIPNSPSNSECFQVTTRTDLRIGAGFSYGVRHTLRPREEVLRTSQEPEQNWYYVITTDNQKEGWMLIRNDGQNSNVTFCNRSRQR